MLQISGPYDVGGECPPPTFKLYDNCCCGITCCWSHCGLSSPPLDCLQEVPNAQWHYDLENGYFSAFIIH